MNSPLTPLQRLRELFVAEAEKTKAKVLVFLVSPTESPEVHVLVELDEDLFLDDEARETNAEIEALERQMREERTVDEAVNVVQKLDERLKDPDRGILDD